MSKRGRAGQWKKAVGLGVAAFSASWAVFSATSGCESIADLCHPDEGLPPVSLCCPDTRIPICAPDSGPHDYCCFADEYDAGDAAADGPIGPVCPGECVPGPAPGWDEPNLLWIGSNGKAPSCPAQASNEGYNGYADLHAANECGACQCGAPSGTCGLPAHLTAAAASCNASDDGTPTTPFDPPAGWDGGCTTSDALPAGQSCAGSLCAQSVTIDPLTLVETGCVPSQLPVPKNTTTSWATHGRYCQGWPAVACPTSGDVCAPARSPGDGFLLCIFQKGDNDCPLTGPYTERHVLYSGFEDTRTCSPCTCGPPSGSTCSTEVTFFTDDACSDQLVSATVTDAAPSCHDVPAGSALGSKSAAPPTYAPGVCQPGGGEPMGAATPVGASTFCCIPSP